MKFKTRIATAARKVGLEKVIENPNVRKVFGAPIYQRMSTKPQSLSAAKNDVMPHPTKQQLKGPLVSVIVPIYNVENYLDECLQSISNQNYANVEILAINDGSTDKSLEVAQEYAKRDDRVRVFDKENEGLGATRNFGIRHAKGKYLTFVDSDDAVTARGISLMVESLENSKSFFAIGSLERFNSKETWIPQWVSQVHETDRTEIIASDFLPVIFDVYACNKLFRKDSWEETVGYFPEGILYEDQKLMTSLFINDVPFNILSDVVYRYRSRDDQSAITQNKTDINDLRERVNVAKSVEAVITDRARSSLYNKWYAKLLSDDLYWYYREVPRATAQFAEELQTAVKYFSGNVTPEILALMPFDRRLMYLALANGTLEDFHHVLMFFQQYGSYYQMTRTQDGNFVASSNVERELSFTISDEAKMICNDNIQHNLTALNQINNADGSVDIEYLGFIENSDLRPTELFTAQLIDQNTKMPIHELEIISSKNPEANGLTKNSFIDYTDSVFRIHLSAELLSFCEQKSTSSTNDNFALQIKSKISNEVLPTANTSVYFDFHGFMPGTISNDGLRFEFKESKKHLLVSIVRPAIVLDSVAYEDRNLVFSMSINDDADKYWREAISRNELRLVAKNSKEKLFDVAVTETDGCATAVATLPLPRNNATQNLEAYDLVLQSGRMLETLLISRAAKNEYYPPHFALVFASDGHATIEKFVQFGIVTEFHTNEDPFEFVVSGQVFFDMAYVRQSVPSFALVGKEGNIYPSSVSYDAADCTFVAKFPLTTCNAYGQTTTWKSGSYILQALQPANSKLPASIWLRSEVGNSGRIRSTTYTDYARIVVTTSPGAKALNIRLLPPLKSSDVGKYAQHNHFVTYMQDREDGNTLEQAVFFESFNGNTISDTPKAISRELLKQRPDLVQYWSVKDRSIAVPEGTIPLVRSTKEWWEKLSTSKYLVSNNNFPSQFRKHPEQIYVETWHGTPLKKIGNDVPSGNLSLLYRDLMKREGEQYWNYFLAQSKWAGDVMEKAFDHKAERIDLGYPRNCDLFGQAALNSRANTRKYYGISDNTRVVLYAPTWRDNIKAANKHYDKVTYLDFKMLEKEFGTNTIILVRGHMNTIDSGRLITGRNVIDVTDYPDINDLINASDLLITDYSSVMFDYINTFKPIIYLAPDFTLYRDVTRGFYFDFADAAPGPIVKSTKEVITWLKDIDKLHRIYSWKYRSFRKRFAPNDGPDVTTEVVNRIFAKK